MNENEKEKNGNKKKLWLALAICFLAIAVACVIIIVKLSTHDKGYEDFKETEEVTTAVPDTTEADTTAVETEPPLPDNPIDFDGLKEQNPDVYAWIQIPETQIDYPIVQSETREDEYYLRRDWLGNYDVCGCIFTQPINKKDFSDPNTLIYGHYMWDGTYFGDLHKFRDEDFFEKNDKFYIYTPGHKLTYQIFAAYEYDNRHIMYSFNFADEEVVAEYFSDCLHPQTIFKNVRDGVTLNIDDKIITLSTCVENSDPEKRYLVQGVLIDDELTK